jgi:hypothetical protein
LVPDDEALPQDVLHIANLVGMNGGVDVETKFEARVVSSDEILTTKLILRPE